MQFVYDTNVLVDFRTIKELDLPFLLDGKIIMCSETMTEELLVPKGFGVDLESRGLHPVELSTEELNLSSALG